MTEYAPATVRRLRELLPEAEVVHHDLLRDGPLEAELDLFHRLDASFSNRQWRSGVAGFRRRSGTFAGWIRTRGA